MASLAWLAFPMGVGFVQHQSTLWDLHVLLPGFLLCASLAALAAVRVSRVRNRPEPPARNVAILYVFLHLFLITGTALAGVTWATWRAEVRLADALPAASEQRDIDLVGLIDGLPERTPQGTRFRFKVERVLTPAVHAPQSLSLVWNRQFRPPAFRWAQDDEGDNAAGSGHATLVPGQRWQLRVRLRRPYGNANPHGFDYEAWLLQQGVRATGYVRSGDAAANRVLAEFVVSFASVVHSARYALRERIEKALAGRAYAGVIVALVVGDQRAIDSGDWEIFGRTGISHLVSISGLHVTMLAGLAAWLTLLGVRYRTRVTGRLPWHVPAHRWAALAGVGVALVYCLLAGMGVPAQRTLYMLAIIAFALWSGRTGMPVRVLALALWVVVVIDPWAVLAPGFWLSFSAVGLIFYVTGGRPRPATSLEFPADIETQDQRPRVAWQAVVRLLREAARVQWAISLGLIPLGLWLFQQFSLIGPLANAVAIPLVSYAITPLAIAGAFLPGIAGDLLLAAAHGLMQALGGLLGWMASVPWAMWSAAAAPAWAMAVGMLGVLWCLAPPAVPLRWMGALALLPVAFWPGERPQPGHLRVTALDVGQGSALLIETHSRRYLYDTGPWFSPSADAGSRVVLPYLRAHGIAALDGMVVSHNDLDHSGGAVSILDRVRVGWVAGSLPENSLVGQRLRADPLSTPGAVIPCQASWQWQVDGYRFEFLHPGADAPSSRRANALSCVLRITAQDGPAPAVLLTGDIERAQENELIARYAPEQLRSDVLLVPHHGSLTSSSPAFLDRVQARVAIVQAGHQNRFGHPRPQVLQRFAERGTALWRTDQHGALSLDISHAGVTVQAWRKTHRRYWHGR